MSFSEILEIFSYPFVQRALVAGVFVSLCAAILGVVLVLKRYSLIGHGLADVGFASVSLALAAGVPVLLVSTPMVVAAAVLIMFISQQKEIRGDIAIGMVATGSLAAGVIITALSKGFNADVYDYMFGSIMAVSNEYMIMSVVLSLLIITLFIVFYNRLFLITFDEDFAKACGAPISFYQFLIALLTALTVVLGMRMMGTLLISSLIIFPAMTAKGMVKSFKAVIVFAAVISVLCFLIGLFVSFIFNMPTGASVVAVNVIVLILSILFRKIRAKGYE